MKRELNNLKRYLKKTNNLKPTTTKIMRLTEESEMGTMNMSV